MNARWQSSVLPAAAALFLAAGGVVAALHGIAGANPIWFAGLLITGVPVLWETVRRAGQGHFAIDVVATLAIVSAAILGQPLAGLVIVLMQSGGAALERMAEGRASEAVRALEEAAPRISHRARGTELVDVPVGEVAVGDLLVIRPGDLIPCDGVITEGRSDLDAATLTGEPLPVDGRPGVTVMSGARNGSGLLQMRATAVAGESQYARIVELVRTAQSSKAPVQRMADRYAIWFTPITLGVCVIAFAISHDWVRVLAVLVVATPCPLILAAPIGVVGGINRAARRGVLLRNGGALERLAQADTAVFDKTGTITLGAPRVQAIQALPPRDRETLFGYAAAIEQASGHLLARVTVAAAQAEGIALAAPSASREEPGLGVSGTVDGHVVHVGGRAYVLEHSAPDAEALSHLDQGSAMLRAYVAIDGALAGTIDYADELRHDLHTTLARLRSMGIERMLLLSGDRASSVQAVASSAGFTDARGDLLPGDRPRSWPTCAAKGAS
jgi:heavy metal translocating P-type ATPase